MDTVYIVVFLNGNYPGDPLLQCMSFTTKEAAEKHAKAVYIKGENYVIYESKKIAEHSLV
jgi:hypothetical protein